MKTTSNNHRPRWRVSEPVAAKLSQIRRDCSQTWDALFQKLVGLYERESSQSPPPAQPSPEIALLTARLGDLDELCRKLAEQIDCHDELLASLEPLLEQNSASLSQLVQLMQLALQAASPAESQPPLGGRKPSSKLRDFINSRS
jgi:hypothetical protein